MDNKTIFSETSPFIFPRKWIPNDGQQDHFFWNLSLHIPKEMNP